ncbi:MAG: class I SAM-dependent methyltransferase [Candidatus Nitrosopolaris sp.]
MIEAKSYFDLHAGHHAYHKDPEVYTSLIHHLKKLKLVSKEKIRILDLGCGDGSFINSMIGYGINADFVGLDVSSSMIQVECCRP